MKKIHEISEFIYVASSSVFFQQKHQYFIDSLIFRLLLLSSVCRMVVFWNWILRTQCYSGCLIFRIVYVHVLLIIQNINVKFVDFPWNFVNVLFSFIISFFQKVLGIKHSAVLVPCLNNYNIILNLAILVLCA